MRTGAVVGAGTLALGVGRGWIESGRGSTNARESKDDLGELHSGADRLMNMGRGESDFMKLFRVLDITASAGMERPVLTESRSNLRTPIIYKCEHCKTDTQYFCYLLSKLSFNPVARHCHPQSGTDRVKIK